MRAFKLQTFSKPALVINNPIFHLQYSCVGSIGMMLVVPFITNQQMALQLRGWLGPLIVIAPMNHTPGAIVIVE